MNTLTKISKNKVLHITGIALYSLLLLVVTFHYHPVDLITNISPKLINSENPDSESASYIDCEICHLISTYQQLAAESTKVSPESRVVFISTQFLPSLISTDLFQLPDLRAPPKT